MGEKLTLLFLTHDLHLARTLQDRTKSFLAEVVFLPCSNGEKIADYPTKHHIDALLIDDSLIDPLNEPLVTRVRTAASGRAEVLKPCFLISAERKLPEIKRIMSNGFNDIFTKPVDLALFFQKLQVHLPHVKFLKDNLLFTLKVASNIDLALPCKLIAASEYGVTIRLNTEVYPGDLYSLYSGMFGVQSGECLGRVMECVAIESEASKFEASLIFVAPRKDTMSGIRVWIKQEYVRSRGVEN